MQILLFVFFCLNQPPDQIDQNHDKTEEDVRHLRLPFLFNKAQRILNEEMQRIGTMSTGNPLKFKFSIALVILIAASEAFAPCPFISSRNKVASMSIGVRSKSIQMVTQENEMSDDMLLNEVADSMLQDLCNQSGISSEGTKQEMLTRLREFAQKQTEIDSDRRQKQKERIELGVDDSQGNGKAKHKISNSDILDDEDDDFDGVFYYSLPGQVSENQNKTLARVTTKTMDKTINGIPQNDSRGSITAPLPPPGVKPNADGEIVVTTYSSADQNDLTGIAAQQAAASGNEQAMAGGYSRADAIGASPDNPENTLAGGPFGDQSGVQRKRATDQEFDAACDIISDVVYSLLSMTGAPGFQEEFSEGVTPFMTEEEKEEFQSSANKTPTVKADFVGFDPSRVPTQLITQSSTALRVGNGESLQKVLNEVEMQAIGFDGINGDEKNKGGGHYLEVTKVGTFLEGFRKAEVRRIARETATMLLDQLVTAGVKSLDEMLMTMTKGGEETGESGELNNALVKYLDNAVRDQEKKVELIFGQQGALSRGGDGSAETEPNDYMAGLWNVGTDEEGNVMESLDPNDPAVKMALEQELRADARKQKKSAPVHPTKQLLNLLTLLRERVKAEAVFSNDEKGRNLRMLAYCLHAEDEREREKIIVDNMGNNLDVSTTRSVTRLDILPNFIVVFLPLNVSCVFSQISLQLRQKLDSFSELLMSSIDYAESTSHQLHPTNSGPLNIRLLKNIKDLTEDVKERQSWKASGVTTMEQNRPLPRDRK